MYQIDETKEGVLHLRHGDKQGTSVLKRLASISGKVASTLVLGDGKMPRINSAYVEECATRMVDLYKGYSPKQTFETVVFGSPHQASVYIAELMNAPFLPLQFIGFCENIETLKELNCLKIIGCDYDYTHLCWVWCKIGSPQHMPKSYLDILSKAKNIVLVRANSSFRLKGKSDFCMGKVDKETYVHSSIKLWKNLPQNFEALLSPPTEHCENIRQWEFGLPDQTVETFKYLWSQLHHQKDLNSKDQNLKDLQIIEHGTVDLYKFIPFLYFEYYKIAELKIQGISLNPYFTLHPYYEKSMGLIPFVYYNFQVLSKYFQQMFDNVRNYAKFQVKSSTCVCFANMVQKEKDLDVIKKFWTKNQLEKGWFSVGYDCILARKVQKMKCEDIFGKDIPSPFWKVKEWSEQKKEQIRVSRENFVAIQFEQLEKIWDEFKAQLKVKM